MIKTWWCCVITVSQGYCLESEDNDNYPNIQDLFRVPKSQRDDSRVSLNFPQHMAAPVKVDIEKIDVDKLRRKLDQYPPSEIAMKAKAFRNYCRSYNMTGNETLPINETRRFKIEAAPGWWDREYRPWARWQNYEASKIAHNTKMMDISLQTIYMTRHKLMLLEKEKHFNRKDTGYRIAFIYKNLRRLYRRFVDIYETARHRLFETPAKYYKTPDELLNLHQKQLRLYIDFLYYYWVMIAIDKEFRDKTNYVEPTGPDLEEVHTTKMPSDFRNYLVPWAQVFG